MGSLPTLPLASPSLPKPPHSWGPQASPAAPAASHPTHLLTGLMPQRREGH